MYVGAYTGFFKKGFHKYNSIYLVAISRVSQDEIVIGNEMPIVDCILAIYLLKHH